MEPQIRYVRTEDGFRIATHRLGEGAPGVPVVVVPPPWLGGFGAHWHIPDVREGYSRMARHRPIINYDPRGHGLSDREVTDLGLDAQVADLTAVVASTGERVSLMSRGTASMVAIAYAAANPSKVTRMILTSAIARSRDFRLNRDRRALAALIETNWELYLKATALADLGWDNGKAYSENMGDYVSREIFELAWRSARDFDVTALLPRVTCPVLVTHGQRGGAAEGTDMPLAAQRLVASEIPDARLAMVEYSAPMIFIGQVERHVAVYGGFLAEGDTATGQTGDTPSGTAIILFADIVDSTALTERMGDAAFREKARALDETLRDVIAEAGGQAIDGKLLGDGVLATFPAASQAIDAALAFEGAAEAAQLQLHVGIHAGDVIREANNVFGGAVNIASRVSGLSAPGEVLVSATVRELARTSAGVTFEDRGEHALKGVADAVRVYAVRKDGG